MNPSKSSIIFFSDEFLGENFEKQAIHDERKMTKGARPMFPMKKHRPIVAPVVMKTKEVVVVKEAELPHVSTTQPEQAVITDLVSELAPSSSLTDEDIPF